MLYGLSYICHPAYEPVTSSSGIGLAPCIERSESQFDSTHGRLGAIRDPQFADYPLHMHLGCPLAYGQCLRDLLVGLPGGQESEDFRLAGRQRVVQRLMAL